MPIGVAHGRRDTPVGTNNAVTLHRLFGSADLPPVTKALSSRGNVLSVPRGTQSCDFNKKSS